MKINDMEVLSKIKYIDNSWIDCNHFIELIDNKEELALSDESIRNIVRCREYLEAKISESTATFYGINTGFGYLQKIKINEHDIIKLQHNLILSHACGVGEEIPSDLVRNMLLLKIKSLARGHSGVKIETVDRLLLMLKMDVLPIIYAQGSLGASGDLCPLAHMVLPLIGEGYVYYKGVKNKSQEVLDELGWAPLELGAKEGLALINGTQFMLAYGIYISQKANVLLNWADLISAISMDAFEASSEPLHPSIHAVRCQSGQIQSAENIRNILKGSEISNRKKDQIQDPYSYRCIPQVHGATYDAINYVNKIIENEINAVTDNPLIFPEDDLILSGGNFHGQPLALAFDHAKIALAEIGNISERRVFQLLSGQRGLPLFLINNPGLNSGLMIPQYTAASLVSENKQLSTPASVDSIVSSNGQEDHVSMGANAANQCKRLIDNVEKILAIELLTAIQALSFRKPSKSSPMIEKVCKEFRKAISFNTEDRLLYEDIEKSIAFMKTYKIG
jgi:histidine ammonia-lyase